jgi:hypothetical protein
MQSTAMPSLGGMPQHPKICLGAVVFADFNRDPVLNLNGKGDHAGLVVARAVFEGGLQANLSRQFRDPTELFVKAVHQSE